MTENVKYYFPRVYDTLYDLTTKLNLTKKQETKVPQEKNKEQEVMDDILSKTKGYYDSIKTIFESKIKDIPDPQLRNKIDQWYQTTTRFVETPEHSPSSLQDLKKRLSECSDEIFQLLENYH
jgi:DNA phosphorothioation-dependent restriction protein DptG